jgi:myo-inositol-1-phosphate synthase
MGDIKIAIAGIGNCASSLIQGFYYYKDIDNNDKLVQGLMHNVLGGYKLSDIKVVAAFDVDSRKVGKDVSEAIFAKPNCTKVFCKDVPKMGVEVQMGPVMDGVAAHMSEFPDEVAFRVADKEPVDIANVLKDTGAEILVTYLPVGSENAVKAYAQAALDANCGFVNMLPVFVVSNPEWEKKFIEKGLPCVGDDIKAQCGATITHRTLARLMSDRGVKVENTYQLNTGGNTDFLNMIERARLRDKKISKTDAVQSILPERLPDRNVHIGPSDWVQWQDDNKVCFLRLEGKQFGDVPMNMEVRISVEDSPNSAGVGIDAIRCCKIGLDRKIAGCLESISAYTMKHPKTQIEDRKAREMVEEFIAGKRER